MHPGAINCFSARGFSLSLLQLLLQRLRSLGGCTLVPNPRTLGSPADASITSPLSRSRPGTAGAAAASLNAITCHRLQRAGQERRERGAGSGRWGSGPGAAPAASARGPGAAERGSPGTARPEAAAPRGSSEVVNQYQGCRQRRGGVEGG